MKRDAKDSLACIPWYWRDWRASTARAVLMRDPVAALAYRELLDAMWGEPDGKLPDDDAVLVSLSGLTNRAWNRVRTKVLSFLPVGEDGKRTHPRTQHELQKALTYRERCRVGGLKTAAQRWGSGSPPIAQLPVGNRTPSPTPSPSPSPSPEQEKTPAHGEGIGGGTGGTAPAAPGAPPGKARPAKARKIDVMPLPPDGLAVEPFLTAWVEFREYREEKRKRVTRRAAEMLFRKLEPYGAELGARALRESIANDWQGVFPEKVQASRPSPKDEAEIIARVGRWAKEEDARAIAEGRMRPDGTFRKEAADGHG